MTSCINGTLTPEHILVEPILRMLDKHLPAIVIVAIMLIAGLSVRLRRRQQKSLPDTEAWSEDEKTPFELPPLPDLVAEYSHPLAQALFQQAGIPTSGDIIQREQLNDSNLVHGPFPISVPTSGDLAAMAPPSTLEERRHPWRRHSYPEPQTSEGCLSQNQMEAVITEDAVEFFRDDKMKKIWRRRTIEFGSPP